VILSVCMRGAERRSNFTVQYLEKVPTLTLLEEFSLSAVCTIVEDNCLGNLQG